MPGTQSSVAIDVAVEVVNVDVCIDVNVAAEVVATWIDVDVRVDVVVLDVTHWQYPASTAHFEPSGQPVGLVLPRMKIPAKAYKYLHSLSHRPCSNSALPAHCMLFRRDKHNHYNIQSLFQRRIDRRTSQRYLDNTYDLLGIQSPQGSSLG